MTQQQPLTDLVDASTPLDYRSVRGQIRDGDLLLYESQLGDGLMARLIRLVGRSRFSHVDALSWHRAGIRLDSYVLEATGMLLAGGRTAALSDLVAESPGRYWWFAMRPEYRTQIDVPAFVSAMRRLAGTRYGTRGIVRLIAARLGLRRWVWPDARGTSRRFCSYAVANTLRVAGRFDAVPHLPDHLTEPADLARSLVWECRGPLV